MLYPNFSIENKIGKNLIICGIDEVGRGPIAGPVIAAAVVLPRTLPHDLKKQIKDSKKIPKTKHSYITSEIKKISKIGIGEIGVEEIDDINILQATLKAMQIAFQNLKEQNCYPEYALVDGNKSPYLPCPSQTVIKGDQVSFSIAAASIVAKNYRDQLMKELSIQHPHYKWENNSGYGTKHHIEALQEYGVTPHHRKSFAPVSNILIEEKTINR